ncbi:MAG: hypothetical protein J7K98_00840 [Candidatus Aenigmarchaeota archaeon]|nr:hypothetical protein [Candidatus Aenigmarchaeota archaeon]
MSKGQMPIPYLIAIIIGIIVIAVLVYMFVTKTGIFSGFTGEQECKAKAQAYCMEWSLHGWTEDRCGEGETCGPNQFEKFGRKYPECKQFSWVSKLDSDATEEGKNWCKEQFGIK